MKSYIPLAMAVFILAGCDRKEPPRSETPPPAPAVQAPASPVPERPAPDVSSSAVPELPKPGQVNNHSSPEFKGGGVADKK